MKKHRHNWCAYEMKNSVESLCKEVQTEAKIEVRKDYKYPFWKEESYFAGEFSIMKSYHILIHSNAFLHFSFLCPGSPINLPETFWNFILGKQLLWALLGIITNCSVGLLAAFQLYKNKTTLLPSQYVWGNILNSHSAPSFCMCSYLWNTVFFNTLPGQLLLFILQGSA